MTIYSRPSQKRTQMFVVSECVFKICPMEHISPGSSVDKSSFSDTYLSEFDKSWSSSTSEFNISIGIGRACMSVCLNLPFSSRIWVVMVTLVMFGAKFATLALWILGSTKKENVAYDLTLFSARFIVAITFLHIRCTYWKHKDVIQWYDKVYVSWRVVIIMMIISLHVR